MVGAMEVMVVTEVTEATVCTNIGLLITVVGTTVGEMAGEMVGAMDIIDTSMATTTLTHPGNTMIGMVFGMDIITKNEVNKLLYQM